MASYSLLLLHTSHCTEQYTWVRTWHGSDHLWVRSHMGQWKSKPWFSQQRDSFQHVTRSFAQLNKQSTQLTLWTFFLFFSIFIFCCNCVFVMFRHRQWLKTGVYLSKTPTSGKIKDSYATNSFAEKRKMPERISCTKQRGTCRLSVRQRRKRRGRRWDEDIWSSTVTPGGMKWKETVPSALVSHHHNRDVLSLKAHNNNKMPVCVRLCKMHLFVCEQVYFPQPNITHAPGEIKVAETASKAVCTCTFAWVRFVHMPVGFVFFFNFIYYVCPSIAASAADIPKTEDVVHHWFLSVHLTHTFICLVFFFPLIAHYYCFVCGWCWQMFCSTKLGHWLAAGQIVKKEEKEKKRKRDRVREKKEDGRKTWK